MPHQNLTIHLKNELAQLRSSGLYKPERVMTSAQGAEISTQGAQGRKVINLCANNYLGLSNHPDLVQAARKGLETHGFGLSSVRFICGTQDIHKELERKLSAFLGTDDTILFSSCFDANGGVFEALFGEQDAIISDALNHASIIDGIRLYKAKRFRYANNDMKDLETQLEAAKAAGARFTVIVTDGVFSMDGIIANLPEIRALADRYGALVMVDDSHAVGFMGKEGRGTHEHHGLLGKIDILTGTFGKALGGASGGYVSGRAEIVEWLRQRARPYLFSNSVAPAIVTATLEALELLARNRELIARVHENSRYFREKMSKLGFTLVPGEHPIVPVMLGDARLAGQMAEKLMSEGVYVIGFSYPVVPMGKARIRTQLSAAHTREELDRAVAAFAKVGKELGVITS